MNLKLNKKSITILIISILAVLVPIVVKDSYIRHLFIVSYIYGIVVVSWDISLGFCGILNFAHMAFFGIGVYGCGILVKTFNVDPAIAILLSGIIAAVAAAILSAPIIRLKGIYVILVTFSFGQLLLQLVYSQVSITGGALGMVKIPNLEIAGYSFIKDYKFGYYYISLLFLAISILFVEVLGKSPFGKSLKAIRDNEDYAVSRGVSLAKQRFLSLIASSIFTGVAGGFYAVYFRVASPEVFSFNPMTLAMSMILIGGVGTVWGPVMAAIGITFANEVLAGIKGLEEVRFIFVAVLMLMVMKFSPGGLYSLVGKIPIKKISNLFRGKEVNG